MDITRSTLNALYTGFNKSYQAAFAKSEVSYKAIATVVPSSTSQNTYPWLGKIKGMRKWIGDRQLQKLKGHDYTIKNEDYENSVEVDRNHIEDDEFGLYKPMFEDLADTAARHPDELVFGALPAGFSSVCFDGQNFFDTDHPVGMEGEETTVSNMQAGASEPWFLLATKRPMKPVIFQERKKANKLISLDKEEDSNVFMRKSYIYGVDGRYNVGYGFWQMAFGSKAALTEANFKAARQAMRDFMGDDGESLNIEPDMIVIGNGNSDAAEELFMKDRTGGGDTNTLKNAVTILRSARIK